MLPSSSLVKELETMSSQATHLWMGIHLVGDNYCLLTALLEKILVEINLVCLSGDEALLLYF